MLLVLKVRPEAFPNGSPMPVWQKDMHPLKGTLSREKDILHEVTDFFITSDARKRLFLTRPAVAICTIAGSSAGLDFSKPSFTVPCTHQDQGFRFSSHLSKAAEGSEFQRSYDLSSLLLLTSHPCPLLRTQKMTGSRPCPRIRDNSHGCGCQHFNGSRRGQ